MCAVNSYLGGTLSIIVPNAISLDQLFPCRVGDMNKILQFNMVVDHVAHWNENAKYTRVCNSKRNALNLNYKLCKQC